MTDTATIVHSNGVHELLNPPTAREHDDDGRLIMDPVTCGHCGRSWNDAAVSDCTPTPAARCPFEYAHECHEDDDDHDDCPGPCSPDCPAFEHYDDGSTICTEHGTRTDPDDYRLPLPNERLAGRLVVASCDQENGQYVLLLLSTTPGAYYSVAVVNAGTRAVVDEEGHGNIVPAAEAYHQLTGCW